MIRYFSAHPTAANLLMILLLVTGLISLPTLKRETFPDFSVDVVQVQVVWPGAAAAEVEEALCQRIENAVEGLTDADEVRCEARENVAIAAIEMRPGGDINRFLVDVKTEVEAIDSFSAEIETPTMRQINITDPVVSIAIAGPMAEPDLKVYAEHIKDELIRLPEVSQVTLRGFSDRQLRIALDAFALRQYGLSAADVARVIGRQSLDLPSGTIKTRERDVFVRFADERETVEAFEDLVIIGGESGAELRLGHIAEITDRFELDEERLLLNGQRAALLEVTKTKDQDTLTVMRAVERFVEGFRATVPPGVEVVLTRDIASIVEDRLDMLLENGIAGVVLVFLVLWLFFSLRFSFWVAMGLPASFLGALFGMTLLGYSINMMTMVALLIAVGLLMDDSIRHTKKHCHNEVQKYSHPI
jgi:multidrug efflux pump subunit AcrB